MIGNFISKLNSSNLNKHHFNQHKIKIRIRTFMETLFLNSTYILNTQTYQNKSAQSKITVIEYFQIQAEIDSLLTFDYYYLIY